MNQWAFVWAAYTVAIGGTGGLLAWTLVAMRRAEAAADRHKHNR
ncbi:heme exporter protein CcmD [Sphingomonas ginkgonis]|nr:heme exporter protein CcmD [Sphingomonas ginkgonis]